MEGNGGEGLQQEWESAKSAQKREPAGTRHKSKTRMARKGYCTVLNTVHEIV